MNAYRNLLARLVGLAALVVLTACGPDIRTYDVGGETLHVIKAGVANVAILEGAQGRVLINAGAKDLPDHIEPALAKLELGFADIDRAILTHGHNDHAGGAAYLQEQGVEIWLHDGDRAMAEAGEDEEAEIIGLEAELLHGVVDHKFPPVTPDQGFTDGFDLTEANASVVTTGGHTPGSSLVVVGEEIALLGDLVRGGILLTFFVDTPMVHYFHLDKDAAHLALKALLDEHPDVHTFIPAHGGVFTREALQAFVDEQVGQAE